MFETGRRIIKDNGKNLKHADGAQRYSTLVSAHRPLICSLQRFEVEPRSRCHDRSETIEQEHWRRIRRIGIARLIIVIETYL